MGSKTAYVVSVGDELLLGQTVNSDLAILAQHLARFGIEVIHEETVRDDIDAIAEAVQRGLQTADWVIVTGGLGPTEDDVTREGVAKALGVKLEERPEVYESVVEKLKARGREPTEIYLRYRLVPEGFAVLPNDAGFAPGFFRKLDGKAVLVLPGPPRELRSVLAHAEPFLREMGGEPLYIITLHTFGVRESVLAEKLQPLREELGPIGYKASLFGVDLRVRGTSPEEAERKARRIEELLGEDVYGRDEETLSSVVGKLLRERQFTIATAESCTGGLIGDTITNTPGSSDYFLGGVIAYHNRIKAELLGVPWAVLNHFGAVSEPVAVLMAEGVRELYKADVGVSDTGIAGPTGATPTKPVGLVFMGVSIRGKTSVVRRVFPGNRLEVKKQAALTVLDHLRRRLLKETH